MTEVDKQGLVRLFVESEVLAFGDFTLKSGRRSPYFFNLGAVHSGSGIGALGCAYAARVLASGLAVDVVFGPAYKGVPLAVATAMALAERGVDVGWAFNRKERKDHGEGGQFVGAPVAGRVLLVDDVLTAGTAIREAAQMILAVGARLVGVVIALDRQEATPASPTQTAVDALRDELGVPVMSLLTLQDVIHYLDLKGHQDNHRSTVVDAIRRYQAEHCVIA